MLEKKYGLDMPGLEGGDVLEEFRKLKKEEEKLRKIFNDLFVKLKNNQNLEYSTDNIEDEKKQEFLEKKEKEQAKIKQELENAIKNLNLMQKKIKEWFLLKGMTNYKNLDGSSLNQLN
ncbi:MAG: hypothetical protein ABIF17_04675 [Patescibacteria group bacterium]